MIPNDHPDGPGASAEPGNAPVSPRLRGWLTAGAGWLAVAVTFSALFGADRVPAFRDLLFFVVPYKHFLAERLAEGRLPLWNPWIYLGTPFLAGWQTAVVYPPTLTLLLPFPLGFNVFLLLHYAVAFAGCLALLRHLRLGVEAAVLGALTFTIGGFVVSMLNVTNHLQGCAWTPAVLLLAARTAERPDRRRVAALAVLMLVQLLGGSPEMSAMTVAVAGAWAVSRGRPSWRRSAAAAAAVTAAAVIAIGLAAFQLLPTAEYVGQSARVESLGFDEATAWSLQPVALVQLLLPRTTSVTPELTDGSHVPGFERIEPWVRSLYLGLVPLCLAIGGLAAGREGRFWGIVALAGVVLALGDHTPVYGALYALAPDVVGKIRFPEKLFFLTHLAAAILAAHGADRCLAGDPAALRAVRAAGATFAVLAAALMLVRTWAPHAYLEALPIAAGRPLSFVALVPLAESLALRAGRLLLLAGALLGLLALHRRAALGSALLGALLLAIAAVDLTAAHRGLDLTVSWSELRSEPLHVDVEQLRRDGNRYFLYQTTTDALPGHPSRPIRGLEHWATVDEPAAGVQDFYHRLWRVLFLDAAMVENVGTLSGGDGITRSSDNLLRDALGVVPRDKAVRLLRIFGVSQLVGPVPLDVRDVEPVSAPGARPWRYRVRDPLPRAYLASRLLVASTDAEAFNRMIADDFHPGADAVVAALPPGWRDAAGGSAGAVEVVESEDDRVVLRSRAERDALLVLNDSAFPGWRAQLDGRAVDIVTANRLVRGVRVPKGEHEVVFEYRPASLRNGIFVSLGTLACLLVALALPRGRRPGAREPHAAR